MSINTTVSSSKKIEVIALESCVSRPVTSVIRALGSTYFINSSTETMARPEEGMGAIQRALDSVSHYLVLKTAISIVKFRAKASSPQIKAKRTSRCLTGCMKP